MQNYTTDLLGDYQKHNITTAVTAIQQLKEYKVTKENIKNGLLNVTKNTNLKGRWQILQEHPKVICDTAHNKEGLQYTLAQLKKEKFNNLHIVLGVVSDKNLDGILPLFPKNAIYYFCKPDIPRGMDVQNLKKTCTRFGLQGKVYGSVKDAYINSLNQSSKEDLIYVGGSTFVVAEIL